MKNELIEIRYSEYIMIDPDATKYLFANFSDADVGSIIRMANILSDGNLHTKESLMEEFHYPIKQFPSFIKKLYSKSVIFYIKGVKDNKESTYIMINPTLARKSKTVHKEYLALFDDLRRS